MSRREDLVKELREISFYWKELSEGKSEQELEKLIADLKQARQTVKNIFPFKIMCRD